MTRAPQFDELFAKCARSAVHLEMRDGYMRSDPTFVAWQAGHRPAVDQLPAEYAHWRDIVSEAVARGVRVRRARIVSEPVSEYIRFEHDVTSHNLEAGELVRWLPRRHASALTLPGNDFWLFDDRLVLFNHFAGDGEHIDNELTEDGEVVALCGAAFEAVWERAVPHEDYQPA